MIVLSETIRSILINKLSGSITSEEERTLKKWRLQSDAHDREINQYAALWAASGRVLLQPDFDMVSAWEQLDQCLRNNGLVVNAHITSPLRMSALRKYTRMAVAAMIAVITLIAGWLIFSKNEKTIYKVVSAVDANKYQRLPDNSMILLRKGASITYKTTFGHSDRLVELHGDAFFDVVQNPKLPFNVQTDRSLVKVLGTSFVINTCVQHDRVAVVAGKVLLSVRDNPEAHCFISAQEEAFYTGKTFEKINISDDNYLSWQTDALTFSRASLEKVVVDLSFYYSTTIKLDDILKERDIKVTGSFRKQSLQVVLDEITAITGLHYRSVKDTLVIY
ncbi:FecR family protein [Chitinophaga sp. 22321]|uniref:FecR domain-containing protein n=1 Tax=Chitinophaga hostae TaxID=2831022 RepID=A0ABS5IZ15_9BACT|nr:FecR domain-containing protein [Chitinophaga hostae]MBS0028205.1 FecR domain-containing protein [Chitinophaga hostae]